MLPLRALKTRVTRVEDEECHKMAEPTVEYLSNIASGWKTRRESENTRSCRRERVGGEYMWMKYG